MDWKENYKRKLTTAEEAVKEIKSGFRVVLGHNCGEPQRLVKAMVENREDFNGVEVAQMLPMGKCQYCLPENSGRFVHNAFFAGVPTREAVNSGKAKFTPCYFSELPRLFKEKILSVDVALCTFSPPDEHGYLSFGISVDYTKAAAESARIVIAQVNRFMPRTLGDSMMHVSRLHHIVELDEPLIEVKPLEITPEEVKIGGYCAELIEDGACLQLGIGAIPDSVLSFLEGKKDLGIHTEMFSDGILDLVKNGIINGRRKNIHTGKIVATFLMGSRKLYDFVDKNLIVEMHPVDVTNDPCLISGNDNMVAINSAIQVDFSGQVNAEMVSGRQYSGVGGQVDFLRGVSRSKNGKAILAFPSTAGDGRYSRIVPRLSEGTAVTDTRCDVHYVVTEYGIANLRGKSLGERARALIDLAHPGFRGELKHELNKMTLL